MFLTENFQKVETENLSMNTWYKITLMQEYYEPVYFITLKLNQDVIYKGETQDRHPFRNVQIFLSSKWASAAKFGYNS